MDKNLVKAFIRECISMQEWKIRYKANYIEMCDYFKYSGKIEESKSMSQWITLQQERTPIDNPMIAFYFENPDYNIAEIAKVLKKDLKVETPKNNFIDSKNKSNRIYNDMSKYKLIKYK